MARVRGGEEGVWRRDRAKRERGWRARSKVGRLDRVYVRCVSVDREERRGGELTDGMKVVIDMAAN